MPDYILTGTGRRIAYEAHRGNGPGVVFLGGFRSDMRGTKAEHLSAWAKRSGQAFLRFDYSGHGESGGAFEDGCIGDWLADTIGVIEAMTDGPQVLVGSSMGGWIALLVARARPDLVAGLVGIAAAPDFTENGFWDGMDAGQRASLMQDGQIALPSDHGDQPYIITRHLIEDGRAHLVLDRPLHLPFPVRLLQGTADQDVPAGWALRLLEHAECSDLRLVLVKGADHRFSSPDCLGLVDQMVTEVIRGAE